MSTDAHCRPDTCRIDDYFGPSAVNPLPCSRDSFDIVGRCSSHSRAVADEHLACARRSIRNQCPEEPGIYGMIGRDEQLIYVGMSRNLRRRLLTYFYNRSSTNSQQNIVRTAVRVVWETHTHELVAMVRERELIRRYRPYFNEAGQPSRTRSGHLFLSRGQAPSLMIEALPRADCNDSWGPIPLNRLTRTAVEVLNHLFRLRDCPQSVAMRFTNQRDLFPQTYSLGCERGELGSCLAPCAGCCSRRQYMRQVATARAVLNGELGDSLGNFGMDQLIQFLLKLIPANRVPHRQPMKPWISPRKVRLAFGVRWGLPTAAK